MRTKNWKPMENLPDSKNRDVERLSGKSTRTLCFALAIVCSVATAHGQATVPDKYPSKPTQGMQIGGWDYVSKFHYATVDANGHFTVNAMLGGGAATSVPSAALEKSHVLKNAAGSLVSVSVFDTASEYILIINATSVPSSPSSVTLLYPPIPISANTTTMITFPNPLVASTGIVVANSSTGSFTYTAGGNTCVFTGQVQ